MNPELNPRLRLLASVSLFALIVLCVTWETLVAPVRPGGSWMLLKALPLAFPLRGIVRGNLYTYQWASMLSLLYLMEGVVRAMSDPAPLSVAMAWGEILLSAIFFLSAIFYVRPAKRGGQEATRMSAHKLSDLRVVNSFAALPAPFYTRLAPQALNNPRLLHANAEAAELIGLNPAVLSTPEFLSVFSGAQPMPGGDTLAAVYSGHQFGVWAGQLGDGRAHLLGEVEGPQGNWELQLKGSGMTPYSRMGDGRAVLRSSVREYLASEAMHGLGVPTTRALALVVSDDPVMRETVETAAIVTRMSPSFVRFGSFEHWSSRRQPDLLKTLADYVIDRYYPECRDAETGQARDDVAPYINLLRAVTRRTALLMADWQAVGFCHGVMNTDNMSILGLTLDYGPYGFMDGFRLGHICNHSDSEGRYSWNRQPSVALWNLYRLGGSLHALVQDVDALRAVLDEFEARLHAGLPRSDGGQAGPGRMASGRRGAAGRPAQADGRQPGRLHVDLAAPGRCPGGAAAACSKTCSSTVRLRAPGWTVWWRGMRRMTGRRGR
jgi:uncharacterized membrane protein